MLKDLLIIFPSLLMKIFSWKLHHMTLHLPKNLIFVLQHFTFRHEHFQGIMVRRENLVFYLMITVNISVGKINTLTLILIENPYLPYYNWKIIHMMIFINWLISD